MEDTFVKKIWQGWKKISKIIGKFNSYLILTLFYFLIIGPIALARKLIKFFHKREQLGSYWLAKEENKENNFKNQF